MAPSLHILYVLSEDQNNLKTLGQVIEFARKHHAKLTLLDVIDSLPSSKRMLITSVPTGELKNRVVRDRLAQLMDLSSRFGADSYELRPRVLFGNPVKEVAHEASTGGYHLVIKISNKDRTDKRLLNNCSCPVWILKPDDYDDCGQLIASRFPRVTINNINPAIGEKITV